MSPVTVDRALAAVLLAIGEAETWSTGHAGGHRLLAAIVAPVLSGCLALRRRFPLEAGLVGQSAEVIQFAIATNVQVIATSIAWFCLLYGLTVWTSLRRFAFGAAFVTATNVIPWTGSYPKPTSTFPFAVVTLAVMLLVRRVLGDRDRRLRLAERERDIAAREAVVEERARIARELHDAIAHNVSMMVVQAGAERRTLEQESQTREVLETVEQIGRSALTEMRRLVGMLRSDGDDPLAPQPGLRDLETLVTQVREAGLPVELAIGGEPRQLPVGLELSAYRIVQEALTNALKHAGGNAHATVRVAYGPDSLELEIVDDGAGSPAAAATGGGHGLVGMRERVALYGGRFEAARRTGGGFAVRVLLPTR
jgi:signal transduction histidine kinase